MSKDMIANRVRGLGLLHCIVQGFLMEALFWAWREFIFMISDTSGFKTGRYLMYSLCIAVAFVIGSGHFRRRQGNLLNLDVVRNHSLSIRQTAIVGGTLLLFLVASKDLVISRVFLFSFLPLLYAGLFLSNRYLPRMLAAFVFSRAHQESTVLIGSMSSARKLRSWLDRKASYGLRAVGLISNDEETNAGGIALLGRISDTASILGRMKVKQVILLDLPSSPSEIADLGNLCDKLGIRLMILNDLEDKLHRSIVFSEDDGFNFIGFRQEPLECPLGRLMKRAFDVALSLPVVVFILPFTSVLVWLMHRLQSPGPLFFYQDRNGRHNSVFKIIKYRTMHVNHGREAAQATRNDPRVYPAGKWLRKLSIDELPQFINVLKGEMSIVGPRPHFVDHNVMFGEIANFYRVRSFIKPGITGLAQVRGLRGEAMRDQEIVERTHSDLYYLENWSLFLDWVIILKTARQVLAAPKTAY